jgi:molecular chaperone DnaJ
MNLKEAYTILEIPPTTTPEEAKKQYRKLTKEFHPDVNKDAGAEAKFKKINEAYQVVSSGKSTDREDLHWQQAAPNRQPFNPFGRNQTYDAYPIDSKITISFIESVFGCEKDIKFSRNSKCSNCNGIGEIAIHNGCVQCGGRGQVVGRQGNMVFIQTCPKCNGQSQKNSCAACQSKGTVESDASARVNIPGGVISGNILNLRGLGHYIGSFGPMEQHADVHLHINVTPEPGLSLEGVHVVSTLEISLQEALQGCKKIVRTVNGFQDIDISPRARNKDEVIIPHLGVSRIGNQRVILDVRYPEDINPIIETLNNSTNYKVN